MIEALKQNMGARSDELLLTIENGLDRIVISWLAVAALASTLRLATSPFAGPVNVAELVPYALLVLAPAASVVLALRWFKNGHLQAQPSTRLALAGRWDDVTAIQARRHPLYGTGGIMVSLLVGMMVNVPLRAAEFLVAIPPLPAAPPSWLSALHLAMTFDVVLFTSLYMIAFVAALRRVPLFPRLLLAIWVADLGMQLAIAKLIAAAGPLPSTVSSSLHTLLEGNMQKVLISMALWLPYLLLSTRVNVTYRHRVPA